MKMYEIYKINESGKYELVTKTFDGALAGKIKNKLNRQGIWAQVCEHGKNNINGESKK